LTDLQSAVKKLKNWSAPGFDKVHGFWLKKLFAIHPQMLLLFKKALNDPPPELCQGITHLLVKDPAKGFNDVANYRPITCLSNLWKLLTSIVCNKIYSHFQEFSLFPKFQKGNKRGIWGTKEHLLVDKMILCDSRRRHTNLSMCWINYKKAFDSIPHDWLLVVLTLYKVDPLITDFLARSMCHWRTVLKAKGSVLGTVKIRSGIFQGDTISPLLFCVALAPLSFLLEREQLGYKFKNGEMINHLMYMDDIKLFAKSKDQLESLIGITHSFSVSIGMKFGFQKCASAILHRGRLTSSSGFQLPEGFIQGLSSAELYKYLGIYEAGSVDYPRMKNLVQSEYLRRVRKILSSSLCGRFKVQAINEFAVPVLRYSSTIIEWTKCELQILDRKTRKLFTMNGGLHPRSDVDRLYVSRSIGGRGLLGVEDTVFLERVALFNYLKSHKDSLMQLVLSSEIVKVADHIQTTLKQAKEQQDKTHIDGWQNKPLHGQYVRDLQEIGGPRSFGWLSNMDLKIETESLICAAQDQSLKTKYYSSTILGGSNGPTCRVCGSALETIPHIVAGCSFWAGSLYKKRHDCVGKYLHWNLCRKFGFATASQWWNHVPVPVEESNDIKLLWDFTIVTDRCIAANRPDLILVLKQSRHALLVDFACPADNNIKRKETEKVTKYQDLVLEIQRLWNVKAEVIPIVIGALGAVTPELNDWLKKLPIKVRCDFLQKCVLLNTAGILRRTLNIFEP